MQTLYALIQAWMGAFRPWTWLVFALSVTLAGCAKPDHVGPLTIGIDSWPGYEFARLAREKGYFAAEGVDVKLVEFPNLPDVRRAYERGQLDGMFSTVVEVLQAAGHDSRQPVISLVTDYSNGADAVLALPHLADVRALRDRRVGLEVGSLNIYLLARALDSVGLVLDDVTLVNLPQNELAAALKHREVDAVVTYPPESLNLERNFGMRRLFTSAQIPGEILDVLSFDATVLKARMEDVRAVLRAYDRAQQFAKAHPDEARRIMAAQEGVTVEEFTGMLDSGMKVLEAEDQLPYFAPDGPLRRAVDMCGRVLLAMRQLPTPVAVADVVPAQPAL